MRLTEASGNSQYSLLRVKTNLFFLKLPAYSPKEYLLLFSEITLPAWWTPCLDMAHRKWFIIYLKFSFWFFFLFVCNTNNEHNKMNYCMVYCKVYLNSRYLELIKEIGAKRRKTGKSGIYCWQKIPLKTYFGWASTVSNWERYSVF